MCISTQGKVLCIVHKGKFYVSVVYTRESFMCISIQGKVLCIVHKGKFYVSVFLVHKGKFYVCLCMPPHCTHTCTIKEKFTS